MDMATLANSEEMGARSLDDLLGLVLRADQVDLIDRVGGIVQLARADTFEIAAMLDGREVDTFERQDAPPLYGSGVRRKTRRRPVGVETLRAAQALAAAFELGRRVDVARSQPGPIHLRAPADVAEWAGPRLTEATHEELWVLALDGRGFLRAARCVARGGLHGAAARAADPIRAALRADASAFLLVHNHPSGDPTPSQQDIILTAAVARAGAVVGVPLLDHIVVAREGHRSVPILDEETARAL